EIVPKPPGAASGVVKFRCAQIIASGYQHLAIRQQGRRMKSACVVQVSGPCPNARGGIVEFCATDNTGAALPTGSNQHPAIRQQCRGMRKAWLVEAPGRRPAVGGRIVESRICQSAIKTRSTSDEHLPVKQ